MVASVGMCSVPHQLNFIILNIIRNDPILKNWVCEACKVSGKDKEASARADKCYYYI